MQQLMACMLVLLSPETWVCAPLKLSLFWAKLKVPGLSNTRKEEQRTLLLEITNTPLKWGGGVEIQKSKESNLLSSLMRTEETVELDGWFE